MTHFVLFGDIISKVLDNVCYNFTHTCVQKFNDERLSVANLHNMK